MDTLGTVLNTVDILIHTPPTPGICLSTNPSVAFDGTNYLVVWKEETYHPRWVKGVRVDTSGNVLDTAIAISRGEIPHIAFDGTNYLVVWDGMYYGSSRIRRARLDTFGNVLDTAITISNGRRPHIAFDGTNYLIVWSDYRSGSESDIYGARLNTSGIVIDSFPVSLQPGDQDMPNLAHGTDGQILITYSGWTDSISGNPVNRMRIWGKLYPFVGIKEGDASIVKQHNLTATIFHGPLILPEGKQCKVFDITGRAVEPDRMQPGIYFIEIGGVVTQKVVKLR